MDTRLAGDARLWTRHETVTSTPLSLRVLVFVPRSVDLGRCDSMLRWLLDRGCDIQITCDPYCQVAFHDVLTDLQESYAHLRYSQAPGIPFDALSFLGLELSAHVDSMGRSESAGGNGRAENRQDGTGPSPSIEAFNRLAARLPSGGHVVRRLASWCEHAIPPHPQLEAVMREYRPELVVVIGPVSHGSVEAEYLRAGRQFGVEALSVNEGEEARLTEALLSAQARSRAASTHRHGARKAWLFRAALPVLRRVARRHARGRHGRDEKIRREHQRRQRRVDAAVARRHERVLKKRLKDQADRLNAAARAEAAALDRARQRDRAFSAYRHVLERAGSLRKALGRDVELSSSETQRAASLAPLWDASADAIAQLRRWCGAISGVDAHDYDAPSHALCMSLRQGLSRLRKQVGSELFVAEPAALGGFGCIRNEERYNVDTLTYFHVMVALEDAAVLGACRDQGGRRLVWEIGGGWGGFAYRFKTIAPNVTYLITGLPEMLLVSAVYLNVLFPEARHRFYGEVPPDELWRDWQQVDFIFVPEHALSEITPPRVELTLDVTALRTMTPSRATAHVQQAYGWGSRYFYSLHQDGPAVGDTGLGLEELARLFWLHPVPSRNEVTPPTAGESGGAAALAYTHLVGWRRIHA